MRLVEKKCPNCGGELKFGFEDRETKCEFCGRSFEIERDEKISNDDEEMFNADNYALTEEQRKVATAAVGAIAAIQVVPIIIGVVAFVMFAVVGIFVARKNDAKFESDLNNSSSSDTSISEPVEFSKKTAKELLKERGYVFSFDELTSDHLNSIHENSALILKDEINRYNVFLYGHGDWSYVGMYLLTNDYGNSLYDVYKINFKIGGKATPYYSAIKYDEVVVKDGKLKMNMKGYVVGRLNSNSNAKEKDTFGYSSTKDFYNKVIRGETANSDVAIQGDVYNE